MSAAFATIAKNTKAGAMTPDVFNLVAEAAAALPTNGARAAKITKPRVMRQRSLDEMGLDARPEAGGGDDDDDDEKSEAGRTINDDAQQFDNDPMDEDADPQAAKGADAEEATVEVKKRKTGGGGGGGKRGGPGAENAKKLSLLRGTKEYSIEESARLAASAAAVVALDFFNGNDTADGIGSVWGALLTTVAARTDITLDCGLPEPYTLSTLARDLVRLQTRLTRLLDCALDVDREGRAFALTYMPLVHSCEDIGRDESVAADAPLLCVAAHVMIPARETTRLKLTAAPAAKMPEQTIVIAQKLVPFANAIAAVQNLPIAIAAIARPIITKKAQSKEFAAGVLKATAIGMILTDSTNTSVVTKIRIAITTMITSINTAPARFNDVRKLAVGPALPIELVEPPMTYADEE